MNTLPQSTFDHQNSLRTLHRILARLVLLAIMCLILIPSARAQSPVSELAALEIELWPDFDRPSVLVLLTGTLADNTPAPATVVLPLPEEADVNAVAHVNVASGSLENIGDVESDTPGQLTFTTPSPTFRIEYYMPYEADGDRREFTFDWQSDMTIEQVLVTVQQPADATSFELSPEADESATGGDGLIYHALSARSVPAGQTFLVTAAYDLASGQLSTDVLATRQPQVEGPLPIVSDPAATDDQGLDWPLVAIVAGGLVIVAAVAWFLYTSSNRGRKRTPRQRPARQAKSGDSKPITPSAGAQFCHNCGQPVDVEDRFCRECGTALKGR